MWQPATVNEWQRNLQRRPKCQIQNCNNLVENNYPNKTHVCNGCLHELGRLMDELSAKAWKAAAWQN